MRGDLKLELCDLTFASTLIVLLHRFPRGLSSSILVFSYFDECRNKPLLRRDGDKIFKTGIEASQLLKMESGRKDFGKPLFLETYHSMADNLSTVFDRMPKYAWIMKQLIEPERSVIFRVSWVDDSGVSRVNRGFRVQYSSALGPYEGGTSFHADVGLGFVKASAFENTFSNALSGLTSSDGLVSDSFGGAYGGADFNPYNKSDGEIQRFCQSYMTELSKYIGPNVDLPGVGDGVGNEEIGYMYGQYKRFNQQYGRVGRGVLWGGTPRGLEATGKGMVFFAKAMLEDKKMDFQGKRVLITGSHYISMAVAQKILDLGGIPITFSDSSGHIYEPGGIDKAKLKTIAKIKRERGARVGRYIIASTTAKFSEPANIFEIPCDYVFNCSRVNLMDEGDVALLAKNGCKFIVEGALRSTTPAGQAAAKKKGILLAPFKAAAAAEGLIDRSNSSKLMPLNEGELEEKMKALYVNISRTATEFNARGDMVVGTDIASFLRVADSMLAHGSV